MAQLWRDHWGPLIGVATGAVNGISAIDIDPRRGGDRWYHQNRDRLPVTRTHETRSDGWHLIFSYTQELPNTSDRIAPGVETLNDKKYLIWWPAHAGRVLVEEPIAEFPRWLLDELMRAVPRRRTSDIPLEGDGPSMVGEIPKSLYLAVKRHVPTRYHQRRVIGILRDILLSRTQLRNDGLNIAAHCLGKLVDEGVVGRDMAESLLLNAATICGYVAKDGVEKALKTIRSGLSSALTISGPPPLFDGDAA